MPHNKQTKEGGGAGGDNDDDDNMQGTLSST